MLEFTLLFFCFISYRKIDVIENIVASPTHSSLYLMKKSYSYKEQDSAYLYMYWLLFLIMMLRVSHGVQKYKVIYIRFICVLNLTSIDKCHGYRTDKDYGRFFLTVYYFSSLLHSRIFPPPTREHASYIWSKSYRSHCTANTYICMFVKKKSSKILWRFK